MFKSFKALWLEYIYNCCRSRHMFVQAYHNSSQHRCVGMYICINPSITHLTLTLGIVRDMMKKEDTD